MNTYLLYVRQYSILINDYKLNVYKVTTDDVYHVMGKMYYKAFEKIERIDYILWSKVREDFWVERGYEIINYKE